MRYFFSSKIKFKILSFSCISFLFFFTNGVFASDLVINKMFKSNTITVNTSYFKDSERRVTIDDITSSEGSLIKFNESINTLNFTYTKDIFWLKIVIKNESGKRISDYLIENNYAGVENIEFFFNEDDKIKKYAAGSMLHRSLWPVDHVSHIFPITLKHGKNIFYLKIDSEYSRVDLKLWDKRDFEKHTLFSTFFNGVYYCIFFVFFIAYLIIFLITHKRLHLKFIFLSVATPLYASHIDGFIPYFFFPDVPALNYIITVMAMFYMLFFFTSYAYALNSYNSVCQKILFFNKNFFIVCMFASIIFKLDGFCLFYGGLQLLIGIFFSFHLLKGDARSKSLFIVIGLMLISAAATTSEFTQSSSVKIDLMNISSFKMLPILNLIIISTGEFIVFIRDYTYIQAAKAELLQDIEKSEKMRVTMANAITHELITPIHSIINSAELIEDEIEKGTCHDYLRIIKEEIYRIKTLTDNLIAIDKQKFKKDGLRLAKTNVKSLVRRTVQNYSNFAKKRNVSIEYAEMFESYNDNEILIDRMKVEYIFNNLISNAIKYNLPNGKIIISLEEDADNITISFADNGIGVSDEIKDNIFDPFFTAEYIDKKIYGVGLGLTISKKYVDEHKGKIECYSPVPKAIYPNFNLNEKERLGSIFIVKLPIIRKR